MTPWTSRGVMRRHISVLERRNRELVGLVVRLVGVIPPHKPENGPRPKYLEALLVEARAAAEIPPPAPEPVEPRPAIVQAATWSTADISDA